MNIAAVASFLGLAPSRQPQAPLDLIHLIDRGLPLTALDRVAETIAGDTSFKYRIVPKASLARRRQTHRLSADESERLARIARIWVAARAVWGSDEETRAFLNRPHPLLGDHRPLDLVVTSEMGAQLVDEVLGRLQFGTAA